MRKKIKAKFFDVSRPTILKANSLLKNYKEIVWLIGDGRSGTTWVSDLINHDKQYREMFEPFHPKYVRSFAFIDPHHYIKKGEENERLKDLLSRVFSGRYTHERIDSENNSLVYKGIIVKDIFANLLSHWATSHFPHVKPVLLIRNPFAVAVSKYKKSDWYWAIEPRHLLDQENLHQDYLLPFENIIKKVSDEKNHILNLILIWSIINYVPLRQFKREKLHICHYENVYLNPEQEILKVLKFVRGKNDIPNFHLPKHVINRPSRVVGKHSNMLSSTNPITTWKSELTPRLISEGMKILESFGLERLYDENSMPNLEAFEEIQNRV
ncbi:sulfotransferase domain-containing protein [Pelagicoccus albus]|uniref:Sulfotransferase domain-containing protein n=1 Tax=Pelagicoccus albus TaxID=415222 RepID=A0A7X1B9M8_9BACT|nr:sulfotransferase domain-containing protein [Pelagicoccus albus]MBC2608260.1 sulfotransferase domain-containing protein [Pelagicoccus albus]